MIKQTINLLVITLHNNSFLIYDIYSILQILHPLNFALHH